MFYEQNWQELKTLTTTMYPFCWGSRRTPVSKLCMWANRLSVMYLSQSNKHIRSNLETSQCFGLYDVNQLVELIFTINGLFLNWLNGGLVSVLYKANDTKTYIELEVLKNSKHWYGHTWGIGQYKWTKSNHIFIFRLNSFPKQDLIIKWFLFTKKKKAK